MGELQDTTLVGVTGSLENVLGPPIDPDPITLSKLGSGSASSISSSIYSSRGLNFRDRSTRDLYSRWIIGEASASELGQSGNGYADPPSWTNRLGLSRAYVISEMSSSRHEESILGAWLSGTEGIESSPVPASASLYYSKLTSLQRVTYVTLASSDLSGTMPGVGIFVAASGNFVDVSHAFPGDGYPGPAAVYVDVTQSGIIENIRVWVELVHQSGALGAADLGMLGLALKSPNVRFRSGHPIWNDQTLRSTFDGRDPAIMYSAGDAKWTSPYLDSTYIMWEGPAVLNLGSGIDADMPCWGRNRHIRTIFCDSSPVLNPRHMDSVIGTYSGENPVGGAIGIPRMTASVSARTSPVAEDAAHGNDIPWISDTQLAGPYTVSGVTPLGWDTGHSFNVTTKGFNFGPHTMRPLYPFL